MVDNQTDDESTPNPQGSQQNMLKHAIYFKTIIGLVLFIVSSYAAANTLPKSNPIPGGIVLVPIEVDSPTKPKAYYNNNQVMVLENPKSAGQ